MFDLLVILAALALPLLLPALGLDSTVVAAVTTAVLLIWPGYALSLLLWPRPGQIGTAARTAIVPFLSVLAIVIGSLLIWVLGGAVSPELVYVYLLVGAGCAVLIRTLLRRQAAGGAIASWPVHKDFLAAGVLCALLAASIAWAVRGPQVTTVAAPLALSLDPAGAPAYDPDSRILPIAIVLDNQGPAGAVTLSATVDAHPAAQSRITLAAGTRQRVILALPVAALSATEDRPVDITARSGEGVSADAPRLRIWMRAP